MAAKRKTKKADSKSSNGELAEGDWVVHLAHGIGRVTAIESKLVDDEETDYYRIETEDSTLWLPVGTTLDERIRPIASQSKWKSILRLLKKPAKQMEKAHQKRKKRIRAATLDGSLQSTAKLIRDLWGRKAERSLNETESRALKRLTERFVKEWALSMDITEEEARQKFHQIVMDSDE
ncbi:MAG: CarD family transcriptional regulator [Anaerolineales bacterium]|jgi:CarD family transcriptional regulator